MVQTALATADTFNWFAYGFGNMEIIATAYISPVDAPMMNSSMAFAVQLFFGWRIWMFSRSRVLIAVIAIVCRNTSFGFCA
jgi:hypothetical protein